MRHEAVHQQKTGRKPTLCKLSKLLTAARAANPWLRDGPQVAQQQALRNYALALDHSFKVKGRGKPKLRRRKTALPTLEYTVRGFAVRGGRLILPKGVAVPVVGRELPSGPAWPACTGTAPPLVRLVRCHPRNTASRTRRGRHRYRLGCQNTCDND